MRLPLAAPSVLPSLVLLAAPGAYPLPGTRADAQQLFAFTPLLWSLSSGLPGAPKGMLVWICYGGNLVGYGFSFLIGRKLIGLEYDNQATEAAFRKELVYAEDETPGHGLLDTCHALFSSLRDNYHRLFAHLGYFEICTLCASLAPDLASCPRRYAGDCSDTPIPPLRHTSPCAGASPGACAGAAQAHVPPPVHLVAFAGSSIFGTVMTVVPLVVMVPYVFSSDITFGTYMQANTVFSSVQAGISTPMKEWVTINELLSVIRRLREFENALPGGSEEMPNEHSSLIPAKEAPP